MIDRFRSKSPQFHGPANSQYDHQITDKTGFFERESIDLCCFALMCDDILFFLGYSCRNIPTDQELPLSQERNKMAHTDHDMRCDYLRCS
jgi:hypothetical protein